MLTNGDDSYQRYEQGLEDGTNHQGSTPIVTKVMKTRDPWYWQGFSEARRNVTAGVVTPAALLHVAA